MSKNWIVFLKFMSWLYVVISVIAAIVVFYNYGTMKRPRPEIEVLTETVPNWTGIGIGIGIICSSLMLLGFLMVVCYIAENVTREHTEPEQSEYKKISEELSVGGDLNEN